MAFYELPADSIAISVEGKKLRAGIGWDPEKGTLVEKIKGLAEEHMGGSSKNALDLNIAAAVRYKDSEEELVFYGNKTDSAEAIHYLRDSRTGSKEGEDEGIDINLEKIPENVSEIILFTLIYNGKSYGKTFSMVENFFVQIKDCHLDKVIYRNESDAYSEEPSKYSAYVFGKLKRDGASWKFIPKHRFSDENTEQDLIANL